MKVFYITIDDSVMGIDAISLVQSPAVEHDFLCFSKDEKPVSLKFDNSKHIITGVVCLADTPIYRYNEKYGEYYVVFTKDTIRKMVEKFAKDGLFASVNLQHDDTKFVDELGEKHPVPIEVFPSAMKYVSNELNKIGATETVFRGMTENNNAILDTKFEKIYNQLEKKIKEIPGVIESGLFIGYSVEIVKN